jgi:hypothetical protein
MPANKCLTVESGDSLLHRPLECGLGYRISIDVQPDHRLMWGWAGGVGAGHSSASYSNLKVGTGVSFTYPSPCEQLRTDIRCSEAYLGIVSGSQFICDQIGKN